MGTAHSDKTQANGLVKFCGETATTVPITTRWYGNGGPSRVMRPSLKPLTRQSKELVELNDFMDANAPDIIKFVDIFLMICISLCMAGQHIGKGKHLEFLVRAYQGIDAA